MAIAISTMLPELRVELPGIPVPILNAALYRVIRTFFWKSEVWKYTYDNGLDWTLNQLAAESPVAGTDIPAKCVVKRVDTVMYDAGGTEWDNEIPFKTRDELDRANPDWYTEVGSTPLAWTHGNDGAALIIPQVAATVTTALLIRAVIAPIFTLVADTLPDFLYYEFEETIKAGVLAQLMKQPGKDWSNMQSAQFYGSAFAAGLLEATSRGQADFGQPKDTMAYGGI
jgi:hypothetical protein